MISDLRALAFEKHYLEKTIAYEKLRFDESYVGPRIKLGDKKDLFPVQKLERKKLLPDWISNVSTLHLDVLDCASLQLGTVSISLG